SRSCACRRNGSRGPFGGRSARCPSHSHTDVWLCDVRGQSCYWIPNAWRETRGLRKREPCRPFSSRARTGGHNCAGFGMDSDREIHFQAWRRAELDLCERRRQTRADVHCLDGTGRAVADPGEGECATTEKVDCGQGVVRATLLFRKRRP